MAGWVQDGHAGCALERRASSCQAGGWPSVSSSVKTSCCPLTWPPACPPPAPCRSPYCHAVVRGHVCAVFAGEIAAWPGHDQVAEHHDAFVRGEPLPVEDDATWLVQVGCNPIGLVVMGRCALAELPAFLGNWLGLVGAAASWGTAGRMPWFEGACRRAWPGSPVMLAVSICPALAWAHPHLQFYDSFSGHASMDDVTEAALRALSRVQVRAVAHSLLHAPCLGGSQGSAAATHTYATQGCFMPILLHIPHAPRLHTVAPAAGQLCVCAVRQPDQARVGGAGRGGRAAAVLGRHW